MPIPAGTLGIKFALVFGPSLTSSGSHAFFEWAVPLVVTGACSPPICSPSPPDTDPAYFYFNNNGSPDNTKLSGLNRDGPQRPWRPAQPRALYRLPGQRSRCHTHPVRHFAFGGIDRHRPDRGASGASSLLRPDAPIYYLHTTFPYLRALRQPSERERQRAGPRPRRSGVLCHCDRWGDAPLGAVSRLLYEHLSVLGARGRAVGMMQS